MRWTRSFIPTLREDPADAEAASHRLMVRAGLVRQLTAGIYVYLPLGQRAIDKVNVIIREEMNGIGGQEITMPVLHPAELWQQSGRWYDIKDEMFRLKDRHGRDMCLGMTHEEIFTLLARDELRSYRDLPQVWYQIQTKFRDEPRPKSGLLRVREFPMKDAYTFDLDQSGLYQDIGGPGACYAGPDELVSDLRTVEHALTEANSPSIANDLVVPVRRAVEIFRFSTVRLDLRECPCHRVPLSHAQALVVHGRARSQRRNEQEIVVASARVRAGRDEAPPPPPVTSVV